MRISVLFLVALFMIGVGSASAQDLTNLDRSRLNSAAYYNYSEQGDVTILVHAWGALRFPGLYEVPQGTRLSELFSIAGGPLLGERISRSKRTINVRLVRAQGDTRSVVYETTMVNQIIVTDEDPSLRSGDVFSVESVIKEGFNWKDMFPIVGAVASVTLIVERISRN